MIRFAAVVALALFTVGLLLPLSAPAAVPASSPSAVAVPAAEASAPVPSSPGGVTSTAIVPVSQEASDGAVAAAVAPALALSIGAEPNAICAGGNPNCPAGAAESRITMSASASGAPVAWSAVQVVFVVETGPYDGVFDGGSYPHVDPCDKSPFHALCEESNAVPFFLANAQTIAQSIQGANPSTQVSFAMVDFYAPSEIFGTYGQGSYYHVDVSSFVPANSFGSAVRQSFQFGVLEGGYYLPGSGLNNWNLASDEITAMFGALTGSGLEWSPLSHHVVVLLTSTAPQDPSYVENTCISYSWPYGCYPSPEADCPGGVDYGGYVCDAPTCEPAYSFVGQAEPQCEGWIYSHDGNPGDSIANLARSSPDCAGSLGGACTVDVIDLADCLTDPNCIEYYQTSTPNPSIEPDVEGILLAGCNLAAATGGSWAGPTGTSCASGAIGYLAEPSHGSYQHPSTSNPSLLAALRGISLGTPPSSESHPQLSFVPFGSIVLAQNLSSSATCLRGGGSLSTCQATPEVVRDGTTEYLRWNWSTSPGDDQMLPGDLWEVSFYVIATGPPFSVVPVDACVTGPCVGAGSGYAPGGHFTSASYVLDASGLPIEQSFPLAAVSVETAFVATAPPPPPTPPPVPPTPPPGTPVSPGPEPVPIPPAPPNVVPPATVSIQSIAAGILAAGFTRVGIRTKATPVAVVVRNPKKPGQRGSSPERRPLVSHWD
ncbi:MAG: hypothetical protein ACREBT_03700 [Thermoplasmata archaeon]